MKKYHADKLPENPKKRRSKKLLFLGLLPPAVLSIYTLARAQELNPSDFSVFGGARTGLDGKIVWEVGTDFGGVSVAGNFAHLDNRLIEKINKPTNKSRGINFDGTETEEDINYIGGNLGYAHPLYDKRVRLLGLPGRAKWEVGGEIGGGARFSKRRIVEFLTRTTKGKPVKIPDTDNVNTFAEIDPFVDAALTTSFTFDWLTLKLLAGYRAETRDGKFRNFDPNRGTYFDPNRVYIGLRIGGAIPVGK